MQIFISRPIPHSAITTLQSAGHAVTVSPHERPLSPEEFLAATAAADGLITMLTDKVDAPFLNARPNIKAIANYAVGHNNIDVPACTAHHVGVSNCPDILTDATAELAFTLLLAAARRAGESERHLRAKNWNGWGPLQFVGVPVYGQTLGIIGAGRIGARMAEMSRGFNMKLLYHNRKPSPALNDLGAALASLEFLLKESDFISIHVPLTPETRHLISTPQFSLMKPTAVLINTARGPVVDEAALAEALRTRKIFAAGLDVYEHEPKIHQALFDLENAVLLPHIGSATTTARANLANLAAQNLLAMLAGNRPPTPLNPELWQ